MQNYITNEQWSDATTVNLQVNGLYGSALYNWLVPFAATAGVDLAQSVLQYYMQVQRGGGRSKRRRSNKKRSKRRRRSKRKGSKKKRSKKRRSRKY